MGVTGVSTPLGPVFEILIEGTAAAVIVSIEVVRGNRGCGSVQKSTDQIVFLVKSAGR